jgi:hypothetical protein
MKAGAILLVDDNLNVQAYVRAVLEKAGYTVITGGLTWKRTQSQVVWSVDSVHAGQGIVRQTDTLRSCCGMRLPVGHSIRCAFGLRYLIRTFGPLDVERPVVSNCECNVLSPVIDHYVRR